VHWPISKIADCAAQGKWLLWDIDFRGKAHWLLPTLSKLISGFLELISGCSCLIDRREFSLKLQTIAKNTITLAINPADEKAVTLASAWEI